MGRSRTPDRTARPARPVARGWATSGGRSRGGSGSRPAPYPRRSGARSGVAGGRRQSRPPPDAPTRPGAPNVSSMIASRAPTSSGDVRRTSRRNGSGARAGQPGGLDGEPPRQQQRRPELQRQPRARVEESDEREQSHGSRPGGTAPRRRHGEQGERRSRQQHKDSHRRRDDPAEMVAKAIKLRRRSGAS